MNCKKYYKLLIIYFLNIYFILYIEFVETDDFTEEIKNKKCNPENNNESLLNLDCKNEI